MSEPIGPGDMVECIYVGPDSRRVSIGDVFLCTEVIHGLSCERGHEGCGGINLEGLAPLSTGYACCCFRPISRRSDFEHFLETLKTPAPEELVIA